MELRQFPAEAHAPVLTKISGHVLERREELMGRFVEDHCPAFVFKARQVLLPAFFVDGQKALEAESSRGKAGDGKRRHERARTRNCADRQPGFGAQAD